MADGLEWLPFYPSNFIMSTAAFSNEERGMYITLLCYQWDHGGLPNDHARLATMLGCSEHSFSIAWAMLSTKFRLGPDGLLRNPVLQRIHKEQTLKYETRVLKARRAGRLRWKNHDSSKHSSEHSSEHSASIENKNKTKETPFNFPPDFNVEAWNEWNQFRVTMRWVKYKEPTIKRMVRKLAAHSRSDQRMMLEQSMTNCWQGVFEVGSGPGGKRESDAQRVARVTGEPEL